ncbi:DUF4167 domain-containing protein [Rhizobium deserti]|uniref:DUF4167 domain-containing protein n=1 Tax=Rhizobium deserti TaxID=2547961 RepID=A0A4R5UGL2_9HYPH|nr:DUF4167 domain-containing protein [Rhizobium deserti]TDK34605.1 DUF4167 domain-containing protein [Rhizobium deserti]
MRPGQQNKRGRGRGNNNNGGGGGGGSNNNSFNRKGGNPLSRTYDSSGPDVKIRGTAQHIAEKYSTLARDAQSSGDRVMAENYLQHAEHYNRIIAAAQAQMQDRFQQQERGDFQDRDGNQLDQDDMDNGDGDDNGFSQQPTVDEAPQPPQQQPRREPRENREPREPREPRDQQRERPRREHRQEQAPAAAQSAVVVDGSGPQPVIEGTPAEVAVEEEAQVEAAPRRRRNASSRPRRPRRGEGAEEGGEAAGEEAQPALAEAASE